MLGKNGIIWDLGIDIFHPSSSSTRLEYSREKKHPTIPAFLTSQRCRRTHCAHSFSRYSLKAEANPKTFPNVDGHGLVPSPRWWAGGGIGSNVARRHLASAHSDPNSEPVPTAAARWPDLVPQRLEDPEGLPDRRGGRGAVDGRHAPNDRRHAPWLRSPPLRDLRAFLISPSKKRSVPSKPLPWPMDG